MRAPGWRCAMLLALFSACGGQVGGNEPTGGSSRMGGVVDVRGGEAGLVALGGQSSAQNDGGSSSAAASIAVAGTGAGMSAADVAPLIASGTRYCESDRYCFGLPCFAPPDLEARVCVATCGTDADCAAGEACLKSADLSAGCYRRCDAPFDCEYGFDCFDFARQQQSLVCFPTPWAGVWQRRSR